MNFDRIALNTNYFLCSLHNTSLMRVPLHWLYPFTFLFSQIPIEYLFMKTSMNCTVFIIDIYLFDEMNYGRSTATENGYHILNGWNLKLHICF